MPVVSLWPGFSCPLYVKVMMAADAHTTLKHKAELFILLKANSCQACFNERYYVYGNSQRLISRDRFVWEDPLRLPELLVIVRKTTTIGGASFRRMLQSRSGPAVLWPE